VPARELSIWMTHFQWLEREVGRHADEMRLRRKEADEARGQLTEAMKERKVLERLRDRERREWRRDEGRKEQRSVDDLASTVFFHRRQQQA
jgi:flagellar export protein FliJ